MLNVELPSEEIERHLKRAEYNVREALSKAMIFKNAEFCQRLSQVHKELKKLISECEG